MYKYKIIIIRTYYGQIIKTDIFPPSVSPIEIRNIIACYSRFWLVTWGAVMRVFIPLTIGISQK